MVHNIDIVLSQKLVNERINIITRRRSLFIYFHSRQWSYGLCNLRPLHLSDDDIIKTFKLRFKRN
jgi:hypothetical protein